MPYVPFRFPLTGGLDRRIDALIADKASFYTLTNLRQSKNRGVLETTPRFYQASQQAQGTYNFGSGNLTENTLNPLRISNSNFSLTSLCGMDAQAGIVLPIYLRVTQPATDGLTKGCMLVVNDPGTATVTLGNTYDIEIDAATTFRWRVNGGGWTAGVACSTTGTAIDAGAATVYFLASSGFTIADAWSFRKTDAFSGIPTANSNRFIQANFNSWYFLDTSNKLMCISKTTVTSTNILYGRSGGYRDVYANALQIYEGHLILLRSGTTSATGPYIRTSDNLDLDNFTSTDTNEADFYTLPITSTGYYNTIQFCFTAEVLQNRLFVFTTGGIFYTDYLGLPIVFSFKKLLDFDVKTNFLYTTSTKYGIFIVTDKGLYLFDGATLQCLTNDTYLHFGFGASGYPYGIFYNEQLEELIVLRQGAWLVYQVNYGTFYTRTISLDDETTPGVLYTGSYYYVFSKSRKLYIETASYAGTVAYDSTSGTAFAVPTLITQLIGGDSQSKMKECSGVFVSWNAIASGAGFTTYTSNILTLKWYIATNGIFGTVSSSSDTLTNNTSGLMSLPRVPYRTIGFELTLPNSATPKPCAKTTIRGIELEVYTAEATR